MKPGNDLAHQRRNKSVGLNPRWFFLPFLNVCVGNPGMRKKNRKGDWIPDTDIWE
ncbi:MAG: hypothetical protein L3J17_01400 [Candidatus Jettenia sp.]|nr:MAG: hypothetical protein L3J17_01400 [Candidatus Jettenia sp.]